MQKKETEPEGSVSKLIEVIPALKMNLIMKRPLKPGLKSEGFP